MIVEINATAGPDHPPIVALHGFTGSAESWRPFGPALGERARVYAVTLPGHGPRSPVAEGFDANVDAIAAAITRAGLEQCHLLGYSLGARTALGIAARHPELARRLTLIGVHAGLATDAERQARRAADAAWIEMLRRDGIDAFVDAWQRQPIFASQTEGETRADLDRLRHQRTIRAGHDPFLLARSLEHMGLGAMPYYRAHLRAITMPVRLVAGELDARFRDLARALHGELPHAELVIAPGCGHNVLLEARITSWW